jgi:hypothetical protein
MGPCWKTTDNIYTEFYKKCCTSFEITVPGLTLPDLTEPLYLYKSSD